LSQNTVGPVPNGEPQQHEEQYRQSKAHQRHDNGGVLLIKTSYHASDCEETREKDYQPLHVFQTARIRMRLSSAFCTLPVTPEPKGNDWDVIEVISLETSYLMRAARRIT
jgi:hypothetical protein